MLKVRKNFRITQAAEEMLKRLKDKLGLDETAIVELAIRRLAEIENIKSQD